jgi:hypothetical protein
VVEPEQTDRESRGSVIGALLPAEQRLIEHAAAGTRCVLTGTAAEDRRVRAEVLYDLFADGPGRGRVHARGVRLTGAVIDELLDFEHTILAAPLALEHCELRAGFTFRSARADAVELVDCRIVGAPDAARLQTGSLRLSGSVITAWLSLAGAVVDGDLDLDSVHLLGADLAGTALLADQLRVGGGAFLGDVETHGTVRLLGAGIGGNLDLDGARLVAVDTVLLADGLRVGGGVFLGKGLRAVGAIRLAGATVDGQLSLGGASIAGTDDDGCSLVADGLHVGRDAFLDDGFTTAGAVRLTGTTVGGNLEMDGARVDGSDAHGNAVVASRVRVGGDLLLGEGFDAAGTLRLAQAVVEGQLALAPARSTPLVLTGARCGELADEEASWPDEGGLVLRGFRFGTLAAGTAWRRRLAWIRRQGLVDWSPDPYEQLAGFYGSVGDETALRHVRIAKHDDELRHLRRTRKPGTLAYRFWRRPFGWLLGYGYRRHRAGWLLVATLLAAGLLFRRAEIEGGMVPDPPPAKAQAQPCGKDHPCFNSMVYGADVVLPVVDLGQDRTWRPVETGSGGPVWVWARWAFIAAGWILASIFVAAFAGLVPLS